VIFHLRFYRLLSNTDEYRSSRGEYQPNSNSYGASPYNIYETFPTEQQERENYFGTSGASDSGRITTYGATMPYGFSGQRAYPMFMPMPIQSRQFHPGQQYQFSK